MQSCYWVRLQQVREKSPFYSRAVRSPEDAYQIVKEFMEKCDRETVLAVMLDTKHQINGIHVVSVGCLNSSLMHPREVYKAAIIANAAAIIIAHNHPSGVPDPSPEDMDTAKRLKQAGNLLGIDLLDFLIVGDNRFVSLKSRVALDQAGY